MPPRGKKKAQTPAQATPAEPAVTTENQTQGATTETTPTPPVAEAPGSKFVRPDREGRWKVIRQTTNVDYFDVRPVNGEIRLTDGRYVSGLIHPGDVWSYEGPIPEETAEETEDVGTEENENENEPA
jgi:hypothetical protein